MINTFKSLLGNRKGDLRITNQKFSDEIISIKNATGYIFIKIVFNKCTFDRLNFGSTAFSQCNFHKCTFIESNLNAAEIYQCKFDNSTFIKSDFSESEISETNFHCSQFEEASFAQAYLENCNFQDTKFKDTDTRGLCAIIVDSKFCIQGCSISLNGGFNFDKLLEFVNSI